MRNNSPYPFGLTLKFIASICSLYVLVIAYFYIFQDSFIFHPTSSPTTLPPSHFSEMYIDSSLHAWMSDAPTENSPLLLYCHGNGATLPKLKHAAEIFYAFGFQTLMFEYRGYGNSAPTYLSEKSVFEDALKAYEFLKEKFPSRKIFVWGHSLGSSVAAYVSSIKHPQGVILEGAFPEIIEAGKFHYPYLMYFEPLIKNAFKTKNFLQTDIPKLFIHGDQDIIIPHSLGQRLFDMSLPPKRFLSIPGMGHTDFPSIAYKYKNDILNFINHTQ